jgi:sulfide:quinone oxidoreductase
MNHFQILIIGGGNAGLSVASRLLLKNKELSIGIVDPSEKHYYQPAWTLVGAGVFDIAETEKKEADYIPKNSSWIKEAVATFSPEKNSITCSNGTELTYDFMVVCPGIQLDWNKIEGLTEVTSNYSFKTAPYTWELIKNFKGGTAVFTNPSTPIKCGGAPHKIMYLACDYWRKKGILDQCEVHYVSGASVIFGVPEYAETLKKKLAQYNIKVHFGSTITAIDGKTKTIHFESKEEPIAIESKFATLRASSYRINKNQNETNISKVSLNFDICHTVPPQSAPDFIKKSPLSDTNNLLGYVEIDKNTMQHSRFKNIFSLGDCTNAPYSKTGAAIRKQAPVVVENLLNLIENKPLSATYDGYSACPIPTQYGKLMLAEFDYSNKPKMTFPFDQAKPRWSMWILKTKILPWFYWNKILKGTA